MAKIEVAIVGGGIAGLALAAGLVKKPHLNVRVYEAVEEYSDVGAGLALHRNAIRAMTLIGSEVRQAYIDKALDMGEEDEEMVTKVILAQGDHKGQLVAELGRAKGRKTVSRADLLDGLRALIPPECICLGSRVRAIHDKSNGNLKRSYKRPNNVKLKMADGTYRYADCLLGADGIHSVTRSYLLGHQHTATKPKNHDGWHIYRTMVTTEEARKQINPKWTTSVPILIGPRGHINCIPLNKNTRLSAGIAVRGVKLSPDGQAPALDHKNYADYREDAQDIIRMIEKGKRMEWQAADLDHAPFYAQHNVAMLGDAAHAALPFAGNGAAQALEDAAVLNCLFDEVKKREDIELALRVFDEVRRPRSQAVVELSCKFGRVYAYAEDGMHEDPKRMKKFFADAASFTNDFDVDGQNITALHLYRYRRMAMEDSDSDSVGVLLDFDDLHDHQTGDDLASRRL
ncbi:hypothetical protein F5Y08DRAFT_351232 [Xylaria arbuscula]|nr:hypothetical protein F5Y08DRAFT_351232 [Xylaria arbuscula]